MNKSFNLVGLAKRAGKVVCGEEAVKEGIRSGKLKLVIIAEDVSNNTRKSIINSCKHYGVTYYFAGTKEELGHAVGNNFNAVLAISDEGFAKTIERNLQLITIGGEQL